MMTLQRPLGESVNTAMRWRCFFQHRWDTKTLTRLDGSVRIVKKCLQCSETEVLRAEHLWSPLCCLRCG